MKVSYVVAARKANLEIDHDVVDPWGNSLRTDAMVDLFIAVLSEVARGAKNSRKLARAALGRKIL